VRERRSRHDPGRLVRDLAVSLAGGGDCLADLAALRDEPALFGEVASDATAWRLVAALDEGRLGAVRAARARARRRVWALAGRPGRVILDIDATLVTAHSEKEGAAGTYKGGFGFHPLLCYEAATGEGLAGLLRPGNAGFNTAAEHIDVFERALAQLPEEALTPGLLVRCDRGGATHAFVDHVAAGRSAAGSGRSRAPSSPSRTRTATASRSSSPTSKEGGSLASSGSTAPAPPARTGSAAAKTPVFATSPSTPSR